MRVSVSGSVEISQLLEQSAGRHGRLCPRQVLGVRMGLLAGRVLEVDLPDSDKRLVAFVETDGCAADGVSVATGCTVGGRTLRVVDFGKVAATFVDVRADRAVRVVPQAGIREAAQSLAPRAKSRWHAQLEAYKVMPDSELLAVQRVTLTVSLEKLLSKPGVRVNCEMCNEEIINEREMVIEGTILCRACAGYAYYRALGQTLNADVCSGGVAHHLADR